MPYIFSNLPAGKRFPYHRPMLRTLLLTNEDTTIRVVGRGFKDLGVELDHFSESTAALAQAGCIRYDAIVVDDCITDSHIVLAKLIELPSCNKAIRIVLGDPATTLHAVFKTGTQLILYKPLSLDRVRQGLRAMHNLMARDRRRADRRVYTALPARASHRMARSSWKPILIADISESGAALQFERGDLPSSGPFNIEFALPGDAEPVRAIAEFVWHHTEGEAGVRFLDMPSEARKRLSLWLKLQPSKSNSRARTRSAGA